MNERSIVHPIAHAKPKALEASVQRKGGRLAAECECGWYCMHNHKSVGAAENCVDGHEKSLGR